MDLSENISPTPKARSSVHQVVLKWFADQTPGTVLDIPAGFGHLSYKLLEMGFSPICAEIQPEIVRTSELKTIYSDLNRHIDAPDESFDYVACLEGLEHTTDPYQAISEIARVLKPDGWAVFSLPNYTNIERRLRFLFTGLLVLPVSDEKLGGFKNNLFDLHNSPLVITIVEFILRKNGLKIKGMHRDKLKKKQRFLLPLIWFIKLASKFMSKKSYLKYRFDLTLHPEVISGGNCIIIITQKQ